MLGSSTARYPRGSFQPDISQRKGAAQWPLTWSCSPTAQRHRASSSRPSSTAASADRSSRRSSCRPPRPGPRDGHRQGAPRCRSGGVARGGHRALRGNRVRSGAVRGVHRGVEPAAPRRGDRLHPAGRELALGALGPAASRGPLHGPLGVHVVAQDPALERVPSPPRVHEKPAMGPLSVLTWGGGSRR